MTAAEETYLYDPTGETGEGAVPDRGAFWNEIAEERGLSTEAGLPGVLTETSYQLPPDLPFDRWLAIGETLKRMEESVGWWLGDWWRYGEREYGEFASQGARDAIKEATGKAYKTIQFYAWVCERAEKFGRSNNLSFGHHGVVAALPPEDAEALLVEAQSDDLSVHELRDRARERKAAIVVEQAAARPSPAPEAVPADVRIEVADARSLPLEDESIHLVVTSPPYGVDVAYPDGDVAAEDWSAFMAAWLAEAWRVSAWGGRLALNVPLDTTLGGFRPTYADAVAAATRAGWTYRSTIVWFDDQLGKSTARGSMDSQAAPHVIAGAEMVALFSKGDWGREAPCAPDLAHQDWLDWTNGVWSFPGETRAFEGHPAPFPRELPRRLVRLLSFRTDTVLDPFCGSGTTAVEAVEAGRAFVGFDISEAFVRSSLRRVAQEGGRS